MCAWSIRYVDKFGDARTCRINGLFRPADELVSSNDIDIGNADKAERMAQVRRCEIDRAVNCYTARGNDEVCLLAGDEALGAVFRVPERASRSSMADTSSRASLRLTEPSLRPLALISRTLTFMTPALGARGASTIACSLSVDSKSIKGTL
jgi:hypothetical protein